MPSQHPHEKKPTRAGPHNESDSQHKHDHKDEHDTHSSLIEYGLPICALNERSRQKHMIHVRSLFRTSRSRAWPSAVSTFCTVERRCRFRSVAILSVTTKEGEKRSHVSCRSAHVQCMGGGVWGKQDKSSTACASSPALRERPHSRAQKTTQIASGAQSGTENRRSAG